MAVARDDLGRNGLRRKSKLGGDVLLDPRIDVGESAHRAGNGASRNAVPRAREALTVPSKLGIGLCEFQAEGYRFSVDAMAAPDGRCQLVLEGASLEDVEKRVDVVEQ